MVNILGRENVLNDIITTVVLVFFYCFCSTGDLRGQALSTDLLIDLEAALTQSEALRNRGQADSAYLVLLPMEHALDSLGYGDSPVYRRLALEQSINHAKRGSYLLALQTTNAVADASCEREEWRTCAAAQLQLMDLNLSVGNKAESRRHIRHASALIRKETLQDLKEQELYQQANWQANFGYRDSARHFLDSFLLLPDASLRWQASAYSMYAHITEDRLELQDSMYRKAAGAYLQLENYRDLARMYSSLAFLYQRAGIHHNVLVLLNRAELYCKEGKRRNQDVTLTLAAVNDARGTYYRLKNRPDSALYFIEKGLRREVLYWQSSARQKASEAREIYRNEQQELQLATREKELHVERIRSYGLIAFAALIVLLSLWTLRLYRRLKAFNLLTQKQAVELETTNHDLVVAKDQLEDSLQLQKMLKAELQHRVKNNMQLILNIFNRGRNNVADPEVQRMLKAQQEQIRSIVLLHQKIDIKSNEREIDPAAYLGEIVTNLKRSYAGVYPEVELHLDLNVDLIHIDSAIPLGLILNELITNAYKYAFLKNGAGNIYVTFSKLPDHFYLRVADDGAGLPADVQARRDNSMGTRLIQGLTRQLEGTIEWISTKPGTVVQVEFGAYSEVTV
ncbi:MAG: sensor histidine kinase [Lewinella sp.]